MTRLACEGGGGGIGRFAPDPASPTNIVTLVISTEKFAKQILREKSITSLEKRLIHIYFLIKIYQIFF